MNVFPNVLSGHSQVINGVVASLGVSVTVVSGATVVTVAEPSPPVVVSQAQVNNNVLSGHSQVINGVVASLAVLVTVISGATVVEGGVQDISGLLHS